MNNKRVDLLFTVARKATENEEYSDTTGISDDELIQYVNDAQTRLLSLITEKHPTVFVKEDTISSVIDQEAYDLPDDIFLENRITSIEYSDTGETDDYVRLDPMSITNREVGYSGYPQGYIRRSGKILLQPAPSQNGLIRINYQRRIAELDIRRGRVSAVTLDSTTNTITSLTIDATQADFDSTNINLHDFLTVVDVLGNQQMQRIQIDSIDATSGVLTINSGFSYESGESIAVGDYITLGYSATTHSELPHVCQRYLVGYLAWKLFKRDSSEDAVDQIIEIKSMEKDIVDGFSDVTDDIIKIPIIR